VSCGRQAMTGAALGVSLGLLAVVLLAVGAITQRYALSRIDRRCQRCGIWLLGLASYLSSTVAYTFGLLHAPSSLLATIMALVIPVNAVMSNAFLRETLEAFDLQGGLAITSGIALAASTAPAAAAVQYSPEDVRRLLVAPASAAVLVLLAVVAIGLGGVVLCDERSRALAETSTEPLLSVQTSCQVRLRPSLRPFAYPIVLGLLEAAVQVAQNAGGSMLAAMSAGDAPSCPPSVLEAAWWSTACPVFYNVLGVWGFGSLAVAWWLHKGFHNLPASRLLPIEYGTFTTVAVSVDLIVFQEARRDATGNAALALAVGLVGLGCALVGSRRTLPGIASDCCGWSLRAAAVTARPEPRHE